MTDCRRVERVCSTSPNVLVDEVPELLAPCSRIRALSRITTLIGTSKSKATMEAEVIATIIGYLMRIVSRFDVLRVFPYIDSLDMLYRTSNVITIF